MSEKFMGVQYGSHSAFDEGIDHSLNILQETAGINALFVYTHMHHHGFSTGRTIDALAHDHGVDVKDPTQRRLAMVWVEPHHEYYGGTILRHERDPKVEEYADRDILAELIEPAHKRGMKVYGRILEGHSASLARLIPNWTKVLSVDVYGRPHHLPCWNNPDYRNWWVSTMEDLFKSYPLDGFKYGAERSTPLSTLLFSAGNQWSSSVPNCFCSYCEAKGRARGINFERARQGFQYLYEFLSQRDGAPPPVDGVVVTLLRYLLKYPEILAWDYFQHESKEEVAKLIYGTVKMIAPDAPVGWHVYHRGTTWDPIYRAQMDYADMVHYSDWIKPVVYHDIAGPRIHRDIEGLNQTVLQELSKPQILELIYAVMGYDEEIEPAYDELPNQGLSPDYVYRETKRCVDGVQNQIPVYAGVGFDIPWQREHFPSAPDTVYEATMKAFEAGASGLVVSREYDEMRLDNLRAVGRALKDAEAAGL